MCFEVYVQGSGFRRQCTKKRRCVIIEVSPVHTWGTMGFRVSSLALEVKVTVRV